MSYCTRCGALITDNAKFCSECGSSSSPDFAKAAQRQEEYSGKITKCPNCGNVLKLFEAICSSCGHEINSAKVSSAFKSFVDSIQESDRLIAESPLPPKNGLSSWSKKGKTWWVVLNIFTLCIPLVLYLVFPMLGIWRASSFSAEEKRKAAIIRNYTFPNERESVLELLLFIKSQMTFLSSERIDRSSVHWASIWGNKAVQVYQKAELMIKGDTVSNSAYNDVVLNWKKVKKAFGIRVGIATTLTATLIAFVIIHGAFSTPLIEVNAFTGTIEWPDTELASMIPEPASNKGEIWSIDAESLSIEINGLSISQFETYINDCKNCGFTVEGSREGNNYKAYNILQYYLELSYQDLSDGTLTINLIAPRIVEYHWPETQLSSAIPKPGSAIGEISNSDEKQLCLTVYELSESQCEAYVESCKEYGFTVDSETDAISYSAYNTEGHHLELHYYEIARDGLYIVLDAPIEMETIRWPKIGLATEIPTPKSDLGVIENESKTSFRVRIGNTTPEEYADFVDSCIEKGFTEGYLYSRDEAHFSGDNSKGSSLSVDYIGFDIMEIDIYNYSY